MLALEKPVWRERTRLTSPEVELWRPHRFDVIQAEPPFLLLTQEDNRRLCSRDEKKDAWERLYMKQIRSFMSMHGMLPGYSLGQITKHLLQRVRLWPSLYQIAGTRTRISLFDKRLIRSEVWAAVTSKVWRDSGRAFFSPPPEGDKRRLCRVILALLEEEVKSCRSLFEFGYSLF